MAYSIFFPEKSDVIKKKYHESITAGHVFKYLKVSGTCPGLPYVSPGQLTVSTVTFSLETIDLTSLTGQDLHEYN